MRDENDLSTSIEVSTVRTLLHSLLCFTLAFAPQLIAQNACAKEPVAQANDAPERLTFWDVFTRIPKSLGTTADY